MTLKQQYDELKQRNDQLERLQKEHKDKIGKLEKSHQELQSKQQF